MSSSKPIDVDKTAKRLTLKHNLERIEFVFTERHVVARAIPKAYHAIVAKRQEEAIQAAAGEDGSLTLQEASRISAEVREKPIAKAYGDSLEDALFDLERALKAESA